MRSSETDVLVCAATLAELKTFWQDGEFWRPSADDCYTQNGEITCALTGVGIPCALGRLLPLIQRLRPKRILNIGIAGAYPGSGLAVGDIVMAQSEVYGDVGFELPQEPGFRPVSEAPFGKEFYARTIPLTWEPEFVWEPSGYRFQIGHGCTVNTCTGTERTGRLREALFGASFETMEGAAVAQVGCECGIPVCELRAISNEASRRDMRPENIALALSHLANYLQTCRGRKGIE
jgi:futalosine hydrolase